MEPQGGRGISPFRVTKRSTKLRRLSKTTRRSRVHVQTVGLNAETKKVSAPSRRREMSLDIPLLMRTEPGPVSAQNQVLSGAELMGDPRRPIRKYPNYNSSCLP